MGRPRFTLVTEEPSEHSLQIDCARMLDRILLADVQRTAVDHAHSLDQRLGRHGRPIGLVEAMKRKARGVRAGVPDFLFWHQGRGFAIELKRSASEPLSDNQKTFCKGLIAAGIPVKVCWAKSQVYQTVVDWGLTRPMRVAA